MTIERARKVADIVLWVNNLHSRGWHVTFTVLGGDYSYGGKCLGVTRWEDKEIYLDSYIVERMRDCEFSDLLIHEVGHALQKPVLVGGANPHNKEWKSIVKKLGGNTSFYLNAINWHKRKKVWGTD
jgi:predicted SprT family Zn-dependent metalloprotease